jgi:2'-5' RNA ligase
MRLFLAIPLPESLQAELARLQAQARRHGLPASWPAPEGLHLTLAFLGEQAEACLPELREVAQRAARGHAPFPLKTLHLGGFPKSGSARVLWLGLEPQPCLVALAEAVRKELIAANIPFDGKPFRAHLTLARFKTPQDVARFDNLPEPISFEARELVLYQSVQTSAGVRYVAKEWVRLRSRA